MQYSKDTYRKIRKTGFIYICGFKNGSSSSTENTGEVWGDVSRAKGAVHVLQGIWYQNSNTVIYEICCSNLSISILTVQDRIHGSYEVVLYGTESKKYATMRSLVSQLRFTYCKNCFSFFPLVRFTRILFHKNDKIPNSQQCLNHVVQTNLPNGLRHTVYEVEWSLLLHGLCHIRAFQIIYCCAQSLKIHGFRSLSQVQIAVRAI